MLADPNPIAAPWRHSAADEAREAQAEAIFAAAKRAEEATLAAARALASLSAELTGDDSDRAEEMRLACAEAASFAGRLMEGV